MLFIRDSVIVSVLFSLFNEWVSEGFIKFRVCVITIRFIATVAAAFYSIKKLQTIKLMFISY